MTINATDLDKLSAQRYADTLKSALDGVSEPGGIVIPSALPSGLSLPSVDPDLRRVSYATQQAWIAPWRPFQLSTGDDPARFPNTVGQLDGGNVGGFGWVNWAGSGTIFDWAGLTYTSAGECITRGLVGFTDAWPDEASPGFNGGQIVVNAIPIQYRPKRSKIFVVYGAGGAARMDVTPYGTIEISVPIPDWGAPAFLSLEGLRWDLRDDLP